MVILGLALLAAPGVLRAQQSGIPRAFELERRGDYVGAAEQYRAVLGSHPDDLAALLGLERVLLPQHRSAEIVPRVQAALSANPANPALYGIALRAWAAADQPDSMRAVAERWARAAPGDEAPYREWGAAALLRRDRAAAVEAYGLGRERLGRPEALAAEMAQLAVADGDYLGGVREWVPAVRRLPGYRSTAVATLGQAPVTVRPEILRALAARDELAARRIEAELRVRWGDPLGGLTALEAPTADGKAPPVDAYRGLLDQLRSMRTREALLAQGRALEAIAGRSQGTQGDHMRLEAAQAYSAAGDREAARRMLADLADAEGAAPAISSDAATALVTVLAGEGKLDEARRRLQEIGPTLGAEERAELRRTIVKGYVKAGDLDRAQALLGADSTIDGLALAGSIRLYRGDLAGAVAAFRAAGPYAGARAEATRRTTLLALLQPIEADSLPGLGRALFHLEQGDTARAAGELQEVATTLPPAGGGAELRLLAGRLAAARGDSTLAERLYRDAAVEEVPATAPAAELALAELFLAQRRTADAVARLEHLILTYPGSVLVPQARRLMDQARGGVPQT